MRHEIPAKMKKSTLLAIVGAFGVAATGMSLPPPRQPGAEALHAPAVSVTPVGPGPADSPALTPLKNYHGWVNPEDLAPMPQCIAQQDHSTWMRAMTGCTTQQCTSWFIFCTHQQWLTELSCLSQAFSPFLVQDYLPYCGRSVLAKAQLSNWIRNITGRTWMVEIGDADGLQHLSPTSLARGYAGSNVRYKAPTCLTTSFSASSMETFRHVVASCSFTGSTQHTGNAARPWEYNARLRSMMALDSETAGYDLTLGTIRYGDYFDKECFCSTFTIDPEKENCLGGPGQIDLTIERLWMNATCGPSSLPKDWTDVIKTTEFAYIPVENWKWPGCVVDMPKEVLDLPDQCATDACELDSDGYCTIKRTVDRACFCRNIGYDSCSGSCHLFETRIEYVGWLRDICGNEPDWHGLPDDWPQLATPTTQEMIPWRWTVKPFEEPFGDQDIVTTASYAWKLGSIALMNLASFLAASLFLRANLHGIVGGFVVKGTIIAALQLIANWFNAVIVQKTPGFGDVPVGQLTLLWSTMPRPTWFTALMIGTHPFEWKNTTAAPTFLFAEWILQIVSSYYMVMTVSYGLQHNFYFGALEGAERATSAQIMYLATAMWLAVGCLALFQEVRASVCTNFGLLRGSISTSSERRKGSERSESSEQTPLKGPQWGHAVYGTISAENQDEQVWYEVFTGPRAISGVPLLLLWIAQWLFWGAFLHLSEEEFCLPHLEVLTAVWSVSSLVGTALGATW
ncbi:hypothetical protein GGR57DRAFT_508780 [Xylariaceae sp. FL1272]|nr:hypothetical protein GGR57DRAFT_508780 [Xylariaceae sp. FL1272]